MVLVTESVEIKRRHVNVMVWVPNRRERSTLEVVLSQRGHNVVICQDVNEASESLRTTQHRLVVVDLTQGTTPKARAEIEQFIEVARQRRCVLVGIVDENHVDSRIDRLMAMVHRYITAPIDVAELRLLMDGIERQVAVIQDRDYTLSTPPITREEIDDLLETPADMHVILDDVALVRYVEPTITGTMGLSPARLIGRPFASLIHPEDRGAFEFALSLESPSSHPLELRLQSQSGEWQHWRISISPHGDERESLGYALYGDLIRQEQVEPSVGGRPAESQPPRGAPQERGTYVQFLPFVVTEVDDRESVIRWTGQAEETLGWPADSVLGQNIAALPFFDPDDRRALVESIQSREPFTIEAPVQRHDGEWMPYRWHGTVVPSETGAGSTTLIIGVEIGDLVEAQEAAKRNENRFHALMQRATDGILIANADGEIQYASPAMERLHGFPPEWWIGRNGLDAIHPDDRELVEGRLQSILDQPGASTSPFRCRVRHADGGWNYVEAVFSNFLDIEDVNGIIVNTRDITDHITIEEALRRSERRFRALVQHSADLIFVFDDQGYPLYVSPAAQRLFDGGTELEFGSTESERIHPEDQERAERLFDRVLEEPGAVVEEDLRLRIGVGNGWRSFEVTAHNLLDDESVGGIVVNAHDVTDRREAAEVLRRNEQRFRSLVQNSTDLLIVLDRESAITYLSPSIQHILGYEPESMFGRSLIEIIHEDDTDRVVDMLEWLGQQPSEMSNLEFRIQHQNGSWLTFEAHCTSLIGEPSVDGIVINARDITERKQLERRLSRRAFLDPLTGLPNRSLFLHRLTQALNKVQARENPLAVLFLDLDRFKVINDSLGHEIGDQLLIATARRLQKIVRPTDTVARFGGDELIVLLSEIVDASEAVIIAQRIISELGTPMLLAQHEVSVSSSVGIAVSETGEEAANDLIRNADIALYRAKEAGSGRYVVFDESMANRVRERLTLENDLRRAIEHGQFRLEYLPEIDLASGRLIGLEVLVRWQHPERGEVPPDEFMLVANETGL
ncbi:MAG: PAS domain S-box protein, partial [Chloroflexota bacterium]